MVIREKYYDWELVDHNEEFGPEDYFNLNGSYGMVKFNPNHKLTVKKSRAFKLYQDNGEGYVLYELANTSILREFSTRVLYNKQTGDVKTLMDNNGSVYTVNEDWGLFQNEVLSPEATPENFELFEKIKMYIRFFFDHVAGKHGFFYICENSAEIIEAVNYYYSLPRSVSDLEKATKLVDQIRGSNGMTEFRVTLDQLLSEPSANGQFRMRALQPFDREKKLASIRVFLVFRDALFDSIINIGLDESKLVSLEAEHLTLDSSSMFETRLIDKYKSYGFDTSFPPFNLL